ncbi:MAG: hypothetical protein IKO19_05480 [Candidatus Riflebacteria bacterium]|nr:hypothetical protein [Candidatus Riflebacteria bacterium]
MKKEDIEKAKSLVIEANKELEAHNFLRANEICEEAASLDYRNPNIYLIQLLARYEVTEIEDLQNCDVNLSSNYLKKARLYAGKELNNELDKYLIKKNNNTNIQYYENKTPQLVDPDKELSNTRDSWASLTTFIVLIGFTFLYFVMLICLIAAIGVNKSILDFIGVGTIVYLFINNLIKVYKKDFSPIPYPESKALAIFNTINNFLISLVAFFTINACVFLSCSLIIIDEPVAKVVGLILGITMTLCIPDLYKQIYAFIKTTNLLIQDFFKKE